MSVEDPSEILPYANQLGMSLIMEFNVFQTGFDPYIPCPFVHNNEFEFNVNSVTNIFSTIHCPKHLHQEPQTQKIKDQRKI